MSNINKSYVCGKCNTSVTLSSDGTSFVCPNCQAVNSIASSGNPLMKLIVYVISFFVLYYAYSWWIHREADREMDRINKQVDKQMDEYNKEVEKYDNY